MRLAGFEGDAQRHAFAQQVLLAHHLGQRVRPQPLGQRHMRLAAGGWGTGGHDADSRNSGGPRCAPRLLLNQELPARVTLRLEAKKA